MNERPKYLLVSSLCGSWLKPALEAAANQRGRELPEITPEMFIKKGIELKKTIRNGRL